MKKIENIIKIYDYFNEIKYEVISKWPKALFNDVFIPIIDGHCRKDIYTLLFFTHPSEYMSSGISDFTGTNISPIERITRKYSSQGIDIIEDPNCYLFLSSIFTTEDIRLENEFKLEWIKEGGSRPIVESEPDSFLSSCSSFDRYLLFKIEDKVKGDLYPSFVNSNNRNVVSISPGFCYVSGLIVHLGMHNQLGTPFVIYPTNYPIDVEGKMKVYNPEEYDHYTDYTNNFVYVFRDIDNLDSSEYLISLHPLFTNGVLFERLIYTDKKKYGGGQLRTVCVERNDFLAGVDPSIFLTNGLSNKFVISLINKSLYEKLNPSMFGSIAILGSVHLYINNDTIAFLPSGIKYSTDLNLNINNKNIKLKWERSNYVFPLRLYFEENVQLEEPEFIKNIFYTVDYDPELFGYSTTIYDKVENIVSIDGGNIDNNYNISYTGD